MFVKCFAGGSEALVEVQVLYLLGDTAIDVIDGKTACRWMAGINDVEEV